MNFVPKAVRPVELGAHRVPEVLEVFIDTTEFA